MEHEIIKDPKICGGKACLKGTRIRVVDVVERYKILKEKPEAIAAAFDIPPETVFMAISYYYGHLSDIKKEIEKDKTLLLRLKEGLKSVAYAT
ncbi:DUF433 domain-containing protein [Candidatus Woesearchaeota archaeon]|nr:DUF433 domain-containing protein [Candidatus Woesearchaeota archaeon]